MRLRQKVTEVKAPEKKENKFILFIDLKQAYNIKFCLTNWKK